MKKKAKKLVLRRETLGRLAADQCVGAAIATAQQYNEGGCIINPAPTAKDCPPPATDPPATFPYTACGLQCQTLGC